MGQLEYDLQQREILLKEQQQRIEQLDIEYQRAKAELDAAVKSSGQGVHHPTIHPST